MIRLHLALAILALTAAVHAGDACRFPPGLANPDVRPVGTGRHGEAPYRIVIRFLMVRRADGTGGLDESYLRAFMRDLNYGFRDAGFVFVMSPDIGFIDDDALFEDVPDRPTAIGLLTAHHQPGRTETSTSRRATRTP